MASPIARKIGRFIVQDVVLIAALFAFGFVIRATKIPRERSVYLDEILGSHGVIFGILLPVLIYLLIPAGIIWIIAFVSSVLNKNS